MPDTKTTKDSMGADSHPVLAYRVSQLEKSSKEGFKLLSDKLDSMSCTFATHKDVEVAKEQSKMEHKALGLEIDLIKDDIKQLQNSRWARNLLSTILGAVIALLVAYAFNGIFN